MRESGDRALFPVRESGGTESLDATLRKFAFIWEYVGSDHRFH